MSEEQKNFKHAETEADKTAVKEKNKRMLTVYAVVFLAVVLCLLLASYLVQKNEYKSLEDELQTQTEKSTGIADKYNTILEEVEALKKEKSELQSKLEVAEKKAENYSALEEYEKSLSEGENPGEKLVKVIDREEMLTRLAELYRTYRNSNQAACREVIDRMELAFDRTVMTEAELTDYEAIKKKVKYQPRITQN